VDVLLYRGVALGPADLATAVSAAAGQQPPAPRRPQPGDKPVDGATWLVGLVDAVDGGPWEEGVRRALDLVLRTGDSKRLDTLAEVAEQRDVLDVGAMVATLGRPHVWRSRETPPRLGRAISVAVAGGRSAFDPELRAWVGERRMRGTLLAACLAGDPVWCLENLDAALSEDEEVAATRLDAALALLPDALRAERGAAVAGALGALAPGVRDALGVVLARHGVVASEGPVRLDVDRLPWRGPDGRWFELPRGVEVLMGSYRITRGLTVREVDPDALAPYAISASRARAMLGGQAEAMWALGRDWLRGALPSTSSGDAVRAALPETLADALGGSVADAIADAPPERPVLEEAREQLAALLDDARLRQVAGKLAETLQSAAARLRERAEGRERPSPVDLRRRDEGGEG
jgi:hypothetical protein